MDPYRPPAEDDAAPILSESWPADASAFAISWVIIRQYFGLFAICYFVIWVPLELLMAYADTFVIAPDDFSSSFRLQQALGFWIGIIAEGAIIATAIDAYENSRPNLGYSFALSWKRYGKLWTSRFCFNLIATLGLLLLVVPGVYFIVRALYVDSIAVAEKVHGPTAIRRSFELTHGRFGASFLNALLITAIYVLTLLACIAITFPMFLLKEEFQWMWICEAAASLLFAIPVIYSHVLLYCWYRKLSPPLAIAEGRIPTWDSLQASTRIMS